VPPDRTHSEGCFRHLFEKLDDPIVRFELVDGSPIILQTNDAFTDVFGRESASVTGESLNELIVPTTKRDEAQRFDQRTKAGESNAAIVKRMTDAGERTFLYRSISYKDRYGFAIYSDMTDELQQERHLEVLHRVLRHNLRNDLNVIMGMATTIIENTDEADTREAAERIERSASDLAQFSNETVTIQRVLEEPVTVEPTELRPLVDGAVADCTRRCEPASVTTDVPSGLTVIANDKLQIALQSLIDNAIRHNDSAEPRVVVAATARQSAVELEVYDNGPGIPETEQDLLCEYRAVSKINHGSGLGLWLVKLITDAYGGHLEIETPAGVGSAVRLYLSRDDR